MKKIRFSYFVSIVITLLICALLSPVSAFADDEYLYVGEFHDGVSYVTNY